MKEQKEKKNVLKKNTFLFDKCKNKGVCLGVRKFDLPEGYNS